MELRVATEETIDDFIRVAGRFFFDGSEAAARENLGPFAEADTSFILAYEGGGSEDPVGVVTVRRNPDYPPFRAEAIPFIQNIEIRYDLRGKGVGNRVLEAVEGLLRERGAAKAGICVGLTDGYVPDGRGACHRFTPLRQGETITLGHDHLLWLVKDLSPGGGEGT